MRSASPFLQFHRPYAEAIVPQPADIVAPQDGGTVDADELFGIEPRFQPGDGLQQQIGPRGIVRPADMQPHIIAFGIDLVHFADRDAQQFGPVRHPQFVEIAARFLAPLSAAGQQRVRSPVRAVDRHGLEHVIDRFAIERLDGEMIMRGDEESPPAPDPAPASLRATPSPSSSGMVHVEQHQSGSSLSASRRPQRHAGRCRPPARWELGADHCTRSPATRFVIDNQGSKRDLLAVRKYQFRSGLQKFGMVSG